MKRLLLVGSAVLLILPDLVLAQASNRLPPGATTKPGPGGPQIQPPRPQPPQPPRPRPPGNGGPQIQPPRPGNGGPQIQPPRPVRPQPPRPKPPLPRPPKPPKPHRPGAGKPPNFRPIHRPGWNYPRGWGYRHWAIGLLLPRLFFATTYYYDNWWEMGLQPPPAGYRWVRYGPDLLLVQTRTRRIVDVIYGAFY